MSQTNNPPIYDFANKGTLVGMLEEVLRKVLLNTDDMLPAKVIAYDRTANVATVQPLIKILTTTGELVSREQSVSIPVFTIGGGGFCVSFPIQQGDTGWIKANDRDISLYMQSALESGPNTDRLHSFEDALFFPDILNKYTIAGTDASNMVIQNYAGTVKISLSETSINMTATNIALTSTTLTHNGVNIGATHDHNYIPGTNPQTVTGPPQ